MPSPEFAAALARHKAGDTETAERLYREILARTEDPWARNNLAVILRDSDRYEEAEPFYRRAVSVSDDRVDALFSLGAYLRLGRRYEAAIPVLRQALLLAPEQADVRMELAQSLLALGRYEEGWWLYEFRSARHRLLEQKLSFPEWRGQPLAGKRLFVWREQGFGDQIMMARFLADLGAAQVTYAGPAALAGLFADLPLTYSIAPTSGPFEMARHDYWIVPMSLPAVLGVTAETVPGAPYLRARPRASAGRIGLMTASEPRNRNARYRALSEASVRRLRALPGVVSLDPADSGAADFRETAELVAGLDLVISVDTSVAHLAGAMGRPVWVLLGALGLDWQWIARGERSLWHPSARIFRQPRPGDWDSVVDAVERELQVFRAAG